jgi:alpha-L-rhamnosidase
MVRWTQLSNMFSVQSDCPHREKLGYGGDIVAASEMAMLNFDMSRFYAKTVRDFADARRPNGGITETAPYVGISDEGLGGGAGPIGWGTAHPLLLWQLYQYYGDRRLLVEQYDIAKGWLALLEATAKDGILDNGISDHESLVPKPRALTGTAFYYYNADLMARIAGVLGKKADQARYAKLAASIREAFNRRFLQPGTGRYDSATQACQAFALFMDLVPDAERDRALHVLADDVMTARKGHLTTGIFGTKYMLDALTQYGRADVAYTVANARDFPGWGHMLENGATTLWEHWAFSDNTYSHNHPMFGTVSEWFFKGIAGIQPDPKAEGFDRVIISPHPVGDLTWAKATYQSVRGPIRSEWKIVNGKLTLRVSIPPNVTAKVYVPTTSPVSVTEGGQPAVSAPGVEALPRLKDAVVFGIGSGEYEFVAPIR